MPLRIARSRISSPWLCASRIGECVSNLELLWIQSNFQEWQACILESWLNIVHSHSRNKSDFTDLIFPCRFVSQASYQLKTPNIVKSSNHGNWQLKPEHILQLYSWILSIKNNKKK